MAGHNDYTLDNADGATFRADLNDYIAALRTNSSSATEPVIPFAGMFWIDTSGSPILLKLRDSLNETWVSIYDLTNDEGIIGGTATDSTSVSGASASTGAVLNTIAKNTGVGGLDGDITGDITGYVATLNGETIAQILSLAGRPIVDLNFDYTLQANYCLTAATVQSRSTSSGFKEVLKYTVPFSGWVRCWFVGTHHGVSATSFDFYTKQTGSATVTSGTYTSYEKSIATLPGTGIGYVDGNPVEISVPGNGPTAGFNCASGDVLSLWASFTAQPSGMIQRATMGLHTAEYGLYDDSIFQQIFR